MKTDSGAMRAAVVRPAGPGPFPVLVILHGTHGFAEEYVKLARDLAARGVLSVAACWFEGGHGTGMRFITPIGCKGAPRLVESSGPDRFRLARQTLHALVDTVAGLPNVDRARVALFGHSRGGGAALDYALTHPGNVSSLVLNSTGYPPELTQRLAGFGGRVLILHGAADNPAEGGSAMTNIAMARKFEASLRSIGVKVEATYYENSGHNGLFTSSAQYHDAVKRISSFLLRTPIKP